MLNKQSVVILVSFFVLLQSFSALAEAPMPRGKVLQVSGDVEVIDANGEKRSIKKPGEVLNEMDTIVTNNNSSVIVELDDGALSVLNEKSRLRVEKTRWFSYFGGKIYFVFKKAFGEPRRVQTRAATIGVRGTTFILNENRQNNSESVALKEGLLDIESTGKTFEIHRKKELDEFEQFKQQQKSARKKMLNEFDQYKNKTQKDFVEYKRRFTLQANRSISLSGNRVDETALNKKDKEDFAAFEKQAEKYIEAFLADSSQ